MIDPVVDDSVMPPTGISSRCAPGRPESSIINPERDPAELRATVMSQIPGVAAYTTSRARNPLTSATS
jgi:hypothetical protein